jgi:hypothetical protein
MTFNWDPLGKLIIELREDAAVAAIVGERVRPFEPRPGDADVDATPDGPRFKHPFLVVVMLGGARHPRLPIQRPRVAIRCYGRTLVEAGQLYSAASDALHNTGPRVHSNGLGIYASFDDTGGSAERDPDTGQPFYTFIVDLLATTQAVTA